MSSNRSACSTSHAPTSRRIAIAAAAPYSPASIAVSISASCSSFIELSQHVEAVALGQEHFLRALQMVLQQFGRLLHFALGARRENLPVPGLRCLAPHDRRLLGSQLYVCRPDDGFDHLQQARPPTG